MDDFVPLHELLRKPKPVTEAEVEAEPPPSPPSELHETLGEVRRFRAALADALDVALERVLCDIATDVVARELQLGDADIGAIVRTALQRHESEWPLRIRVHPEDARAVAGAGCPVTTDVALRRGDLVLDLRTGTIDLSLGARLENAIREALS